jgi:endoplasmic reticulum junction formation protein lunapark
VQKYDFDPAAKASAAAASVLTSKMGAETGLKVSMGGEAKSDLAQARSSNVEVRDRKATKGKGSSQGGTTLAHTQQEASDEFVSSSMEAMQPSKVVEHYRDSGTSNGGWIAKVAPLLVGEDPSQSYALICGNCHMHNGMYAITERFWWKLDVLSDLFRMIHL